MIGEAKHGVYKGVLDIYICSKSGNCGSCGSGITHGIPKTMKQIQL
jgi:ferredoxin